MAKNIGKHCDKKHSQPARALHIDEVPVRPIISNWEKYVNDLANVKPIYFPPYEISDRLSQISPEKRDAQSEFVGEINPEDFLQGNQIEPVNIMRRRPLSPPPGVAPNVFRPFPTDMCGNPDVFFRKGKMHPWQKKQVLQMSTHCAQWFIFQKGLKIHKKSCRIYKKKIERRDWFNRELLKQKQN